MKARSVAAAAPSAHAGLARWPEYAPDEVEAVAAVLESGRVNYWTGTETRRFETEYARYCGVAHAVALANGTLALEAALRALGVGAGDEVICTPRSYVASASCVVLNGAVPRFADVDRDSQNLTAATIEPLITPRTRAIIVVHLAGWPADMDPINALAHRHGIHVIEDCAQAHGATYRGRPVGALSDIAAFSFCQDKIITTGGEGGLLVTQREDWWRRVWEFKDHGKSWEAVHARQHPPGFRWLHESIGSNWRLTEMQSVIGLRQLAKLDDWVRTRQAHAARWRAALQDIGLLRIPHPGPEISHAYYRFYAFIEQGQLASGWNRERILAQLGEEGVPAFSGSCSEIYREKAFTDLNLQPARPLPVARELGETAMAFLTHPTLTAAMVDGMAEAVARVCRLAMRSPRNA